MVELRTNTATYGIDNSNGIQYNKYTKKNKLHRFYSTIYYICIKQKRNSDDYLQRKLNKFYAYSS